MSTSDRENTENGSEDQAVDKDPVVRNVERRILLGALKQVESVDTEDPDWRIAPASGGHLEGVFEEFDELKQAVHVPDSVEPGDSAADC